MRLDKRFGLAAFLSILLVVIIAGLDHSVINVAFPVLGRELGMDQGGLQWVAAGYTVAFTAGLFVAGRMSDRFGRKRMLLVGMLTFLAAVVYAALADSAGQVIAGRVLMGVGGTLLLPSTLAIITSEAPPKKRTHMIGLWSATFGVGVALGPLIGGLLLNVYGWTSIFWMNVPLLLLAIGLVGVFLPNDKPTAKPKLRIGDGLISAGGIAALTLAIIQAPQWGLNNPLTLAYGLAGLALMGFFVYRQWRIVDPLLEVRLFRNATATVATLTIGMFTAAFSGIIFLIVQFAELVAHFSALKAGGMFLPVAVGLVFGSVASAHVQARHSAKAAMLAGAVTVAAGLAVVAILLSPTLSPWVITVFLAIATAGMGMAMAAGTALITHALPKDKAGMTSALNDLSRELGSTLGVAILGSLAAWQYGRLVSGLLQSYAGTSLHDAIQGGLTLLHAAPSAVTVPATNAFVSSVRLTLWVSVAIVVGVVLLIIRFMPSVVIRQQKGKGWFAH